MAAPKRGARRSGLLVTVALAAAVLSACNVATSQNVQIAAGGAHTCAAKTDGTVECWGANGSLQLGYGTNATGSTSRYRSAITVGGVAGVVRVAAGEASTCGVRTSGTVVCWGDNSYKQLGSQASTIQVPLDVPGLANVTRLSMGGTHSCAVLTDGSARCWGLDTSGQLGDGVGITPPAGSIRTVSGITTATSIAAGATHACARLNDGTVRCWGDNSAGQLGTGGNAPAEAPVAALVANATDVASGANHTCALLSDTTVRCWGAGTVGQLGNGANTSSNTPVTVSGLANVAAITAGGDHTCARLTDGTARCWGEGTHGELGDSSNNPAALVPVTVTGLSNAQQISAGAHHTCATSTDGSARCWGQNTEGRVGDLSSANRNQPASVVYAPRLADVDAVAAASAVSCAIVSPGSGANGVRCWGEAGLVGDGTTSRSTTPKTVSGLAGVSAIDTSSSGACAVRNDQTVACWGYGANGVNGNGSPANALVPVSVSGLTGVTQVSRGQSHSCARRSNGTVACWGLGTSGQLGNGLGTSSSVPVEVSGVTTAIAVTTGYESSCALLSNGTATCWGRYVVPSGGSFGTDSLVPVPVTGLTNATSLASGAVFSCAGLADGTVRCWGGFYSYYPAAPTTISGLTSVASVSGSNYHMCARLTDSSARCWGFTDYGIGQPNPSGVVVPANLGPVAAISAGENASCAALPTGEAKCWGDGSQGGLGSGTTDTAMHANRYVVTAT